MKPKALSFENIYYSGFLTNINPKDTEVKEVIRYSQKSLPERNL